MLLPSRYKDVHTEFNPDTNIITSDGEYMRVGYNKDKTIAFIDPEGGPFIETGSKLTGKVIKAITQLSNSQFKIEFNE